MIEGVKALGVAFFLLFGSPEYKKVATNIDRDGHNLGSCQNVPDTLVNMTVSVLITIYSIRLNI